MVTICWVANCSGVKFVTEMGTFCRFSARRCAVTVTSARVSVFLEAVELDCGLVSAGAAVEVIVHVIKAARLARIVF